MKAKNQFSPLQPVLPNFLIAGAAKCGTTSLYHYLKQHPEVFMCTPKEPKFLVGFAGNRAIGPGDDRVVRSAIGTFDEYCRLFEKGAGRKAVGEASVSTLFHFDISIPNIQRYLGDPRIIIILRDPVDSLYSTYNFLVREGRERASFPEALRLEEQRKRKGYGWIWLYRETRLYSRQVRAFQANFTRVLILLYDDLKRDTAGVIRSVCAFLDIDPAVPLDTKYIHNVSGIPRSDLLNALFVKPKELHVLVRTIAHFLVGEARWIRFRDRLRSSVMEKPQPMPREIERELRSYFREDVLKLQEFISMDLGAWLAGGKNVPEVI